MASITKPPETFGGRLREARTEAGLSQQDVAEELNRTRQTVSTWECDKHPPTLAEFRQLCIYLGKSADWLLLGMRTVPASKKAVMKQVFGANAESSATDENPGP